MQFQLPTFQHWSCHNCSGCCRQHAVVVTDEERRRISEQGWHESGEIPPDQPLFVPFRGKGRRGRYRLAHQPDGACVFLDENGLCRIHARFGENAKPLACRIYPYAFHPAGKRIAVSLRFSCPSVVANRGRSVRQNAREIKRLGEQVVPTSAREIPPPPIHDCEQVSWRRFWLFIERLDAQLQDGEVSVVVRVLRILAWLDVVADVLFERLQRNRLEEFLSLIAQGGRMNVPKDLAAVEPPSATGRMSFRMLAAQYARRDTFVDVESGWRGRWRLLRAAIAFARGKGTVPPLQSCFRPVPFAALEKPFGPIPPQADEILTRWLRVKVRGLHFCGPACYGLTFVDGFRSLALALASVLWIARWLAAGADRTSLATEDVAQALAIADHHHGYSPALGNRTAKRRLAVLTRLGDIPRLCAWYAR